MLITKLSKLEVSKLLDANYLSSLQTKATMHKFVQTMAAADRAERLGDLCSTLKFRMIDYHSLISLFCNTFESKAPQYSAIHDDILQYDWVLDHNLGDLNQREPFYLRLDDGQTYSGIQKPHLHLQCCRTKHVNVSVHRVFTEKSLGFILESFDFIVEGKIIESLLDDPVIFNFLKENKRIITNSFYEIDGIYHAVSNLLKGTRA